jgi:hypothetical protein
VCQSRIETSDSLRDRGRDRDTGGVRACVRRQAEESTRARARACVRLCGCLWVCEHACMCARLRVSERTIAHGATRSRARPPPRPSRRARTACRIELPPPVAGVHLLGNPARGPAGRRRLRAGCRWPAVGSHRGARSSKPVQTMWWWWWWGEYSAVLEHGLGRTANRIASYESANFEHIGPARRTRMTRMISPESSRVPQSRFAFGPGPMPGLP